MQMITNVRYDRLLMPARLAYYTEPFALFGPGGVSEVTCCRALLPVGIYRGARCGDVALRVVKVLVKTDDDGAVMGFFCWF